MIFLSPHPLDNHNEGHIQRVRTIDQLFQQVERVYIEHTGRIENLRIRPMGNNSYRMSVPIATDSSFYAPLVAQNDLVYIHSIYHAKGAKDLINLARSKGNKIILDLHGIVPEEHHLTNQSDVKEWETLEHECISVANIIVVVSHEMLLHISSKYEIKNKQVLVIPIIPDSIDKDEIKSLIALKSQTTENLNFIYAGGIQTWQCLNDVYKISSSLSKHKASLCLSGRKSTLKTLGFSETENIKVEYNLPRLAIVEKLKTSHVSFCLRDDNIVNQVSCPTKLIEAISYGCIPMLKSKNLGDFKDIRSIPWNRDIEKYPISQDDFREMATHNLSVLDSISGACTNSKKYLSSLAHAEQVNYAQVAEEFNLKVRSLRRANALKMIWGRPAFQPLNIYRFLRFFAREYL